MMIMISLNSKLSMFNRWSIWYKVYKQRIKTIIMNKTRTIIIINNIEWRTLIEENKCLDQIVFSLMDQPKPNRNE